MKGDFSRFTFDPRKHYTRVLKQQGRVDLDADWNEAEEIRTRLDQAQAADVIGRCGVPRDSNGYRIEHTADGSGLTISPGTIYVDGIACRLEGEQPVPITAQPDLPGYLADGAPLEDGTYLVYLDVWERHVTHVEDPEIREIALGGLDTTTRTRTIGQVRVERIEGATPFAAAECRPFTPRASTGRLEVRAERSAASDAPCVVPAGAGYRGIENRLYRVEIHDDGRDASGALVRTPTFKWSRDNGAVVLPVAPDGIDGDTLRLLSLGHDGVLTLRIDDWVEVLGDEAELYGRSGTLARVAPDGIDRAGLEVRLTADVSAHAGERHLKVRRWDHRETDGVALIDGALPVQDEWFELEDGVQVRFDATGSYSTGDYWLIPARTREGAVLWPATGDPPLPEALPCHGIEHHYCTLALAQRVGGAWTGVRDCRRLFPPLTDVGRGGCCTSVEPGEDIQQAIDTVVAAGGGCVSLCAGVHRVEGVLRIHGARAVTLHGVGPATVLHFLGTRDASDGGLILEASERITVRDLTMVSDCAPALVTVRPDERRTVGRQIALRRLLLANLTESDGTGPLNSGLRLGNAAEIVAEECRIIAEVGVLGLWGGALPQPVGVPGIRHEAAESLGPDEFYPGDGVAALSLRGSHLRYRDFGVLATRADRWTLDACDIQPAAPELLATAREYLSASGEGGAGRMDGGARHLDAALAGLEPIFSSAVADPRGTALAVFLWRDCEVRGCTLTGARGADVACWMGGAMQENLITATEAGALALWLHAASWHHNDVVCARGAGLGFYGSHRARLLRNRVRAREGIANQPLGVALDAIERLVRAFGRGYAAGDDDTTRAILLGRMAEEVVDLAALRSLADAVQRTTADRLGERPVTFLLGPALPALFERYRETPASFAPIIELQIIHNDLACDARGVALSGALLLGGARVAENRIDAGGQAIRLDAPRSFANPHLATTFCRALLALFRQRIDAALGGGGDADEAGVLRELAALFRRWQQGAEALFGSDFRIAGNTIRSRRTAIESNVYGLTVQGNAITLQAEDATERPQTGMASFVAPAGSGAVLEEMLAALERSTAFDPVTEVLRDGGDLDAQRFAASLVSGALAGRAARSGAADAVAVVASLAKDAALRSTATELGAALRGSDDVVTLRHLTALLQMLQESTASAGILVRGIGCRVLGNQVLVPEAGRTAAQGFGGIRLAVSQYDVQLGLAMGRGLLRILGAEPGGIGPDDPLLGITETLIDDNEVIGGAGHGISVLGAVGLPDFLAELRIRGNEIRGCAGAGIYANEYALLLDVVIAENRIAECGRLLGRPRTRGGIVVRTAALCSLHANHVTRCGAGQEAYELFGVDLEGIYGLDASDNVLRANGSERGGADDGGLRLQEVYGSVSLHDNLLAFNRGLALSWTNSARPGEDALLPTFLLDATNERLRTTRRPDELTRGAQTSVRANVFENAGAALLPLFRLQNLNELAFTGNSCRAEGRASPLGEIQQVSRATIAHNLLQSGAQVAIAVKKMAEGVVIGNMGNRPIQVQPLSAGVRHDFNVPPVA